MKTTNAQIEKALKNTFEFGIDGTQEQYEAIRACEDKAIIKVGSEVKKTSSYFTKTDWNKVYSEIKQMLA